jgi:hypothetical protein
VVEGHNIIVIYTYLALSREIYFRLFGNRDFAALHPARDNNSAQAELAENGL